MRPSALAYGAAIALACAGSAGGQEPRAAGLAIEGAGAEEFLRTARVLGKESIGSGITRPDRLTLTDGQKTLRAVWKTINVHTVGHQRMEFGWEFDFRDSWKSEVAAYELDKLLGLGLVPPTVERSLYGRTGSLQLWVEKAMTEDDRLTRKLEPPDVQKWNRQLHGVRLFHQLTSNADFRNVRNVLFDPEFRVYLVDSSRAFRIQRKLLAPDDLVCISRSALEKLKALDRPTLKERLGPWLGKMQMEGLLARRDVILALIDQRIEEKGEAAVLLP
ncbi:MAG TPA: hypothetical protein VGB87_25420 [Vicinamibacteria bacterium]